MENINNKSNNRSANNRSALMRAILGIYALVMIFFARHALLTEANTWLWDCVITFLIVFSIYLLRHKLKLTSLSYALFLFALGLHTSGVYGLYAHNYFGFDFDHYTHFFASLAVALILYGWLSSYKHFRNKIGTLFMITILLVMGVSAIHESVEFLGYHFLSADGGNLFFPGNEPVAFLTAADIGDSGTYYNTMIDILYNAVGSVFACVLMGIYSLANNKNTKRK